MSERLDGLDRRAPVAPVLRRALRYVFPDHWSFMLGEIALYAFVVLVVTGIYLSLFFDPSTAATTYHGSYPPLQDAQMTRALSSTIHVSLDVKAGLVIRQTHHWAALLFVAAITLHLLRVFFTGAFRAPREAIWYIGLMLLMAALLEGFAGYSLPGDLLSGMGLAIAYSVVVAVPAVGAALAFLIWDGEYPGSAAFESRLYIAHVLVLPVLIAALIGLHLALVAYFHHTQFRGPKRRESNVVGTTLYPAYALRALALMAATSGVLFALGGLVQINPVWQWGPYQPWLATNAAQPDWYLGWLIGALRLMPSFDIHLFGRTLIPNPFWGGVAFPLIVFGVLFAWPTLERRRTGDTDDHHLLDLPRYHPSRTAIGAAFFTWVATLFFAGSADRVFVTFGIPYDEQVWIDRAACVALPLIAYLVAHRVCVELATITPHPLLGSGQDGNRLVAVEGIVAVPDEPSSRPAGGAGGGDRPAPSS